MKIEIGKKVKQPEGFYAFIPHPFPPKGIFDLPQDISIKTAQAGGLVGKLDGMAHLLPDVDFFISMFVAKDAESSSQIEGTKATMVDAISKKAGVATNETDADDIIYYIKALNYGLKRIEDLPLSLRFICELHDKLMTGARATHFSDPGAFRRSQNWIGGTTPAKASFVPPPAHEMMRALGDLEKFLHNEKATLPLIHIGLSHAQFETIHPFLDGNGRTGRLLITMLLQYKRLLEKPVLFLSSYFKKYQKIYYQKLFGYHMGEVAEWLDFFLDGVIETAEQSIEIAQKITQMRENDMAKIQALAKRESESGMIVLQKLYGQPIISTKIIMDWTGFSRLGAQKLIDRFVKLGILEQEDAKETYDRSYKYVKYLDVFLK